MILMLLERGSIKAYEEKTYFLRGYGIRYRSED
jgi:hypothetical protein